MGACLSTSNVKSKDAHQVVPEGNAPSTAGHAAFDAISSVQSAIQPSKSLSTPKKIFTSVLLTPKLEAISPHHPATPSEVSPIRKNNRERKSSDSSDFTLGLEHNPFRAGLKQSPRESTLELPEFHIVDWEGKHTECSPRLPPTPPASSSFAQSRDSVGPQREMRASLVAFDRVYISNDTGVLSGADSIPAQPDIVLGDISPFPNAAPIGPPVLCGSHRGNMAKSPKSIELER
jgi:hypothetical protein